jgi:hypothetical protein
MEIAGGEREYKPSQIPFISPYSGAGGAGLLSRTHNLEKKKKLEPTLFDQNNYARSCPKDRQPIILTEDEWNEIKDPEIHTDEMKFMKFGSNPENPYYYVCPSSKTVGDKTETHQYPGFSKNCLPCCFIIQSGQQGISKYQRELRDKCLHEAEHSSGKTEYILNDTKYPLEMGRMGKISEPLRRILHVDYSKRIHGKNELIPQTTNDPQGATLLRVGVTQVPEQSFLGILIDLYLEIHPNQLSKYGDGTVESMTSFRRDILANKQVVTFPQFLRYYEGALPRIFETTKQSSATTTDVTDNLAKDLQMDPQVVISDKEKAWMLKQYAAYENYLAYLASSPRLDYRYVWDLFMNPHLFTNDGLHLILLELKNGAVDMICPTYTYTTALPKNKVVVLKREEVYEPLYLVSYVQHKAEQVLERHVTKIFKETSFWAPVMEWLQQIRADHCVGKRPTTPAAAETPSIAPPPKLSATELKSKLHSLAESSKMWFPTAYVRTFQNQIIGVVVENKIDEKKVHVTIPCLHSAPELMPELPVIYTNAAADATGTLYEITRDALKSIHRRSNGEIACRPISRVVLHHLVVGFMTQTHQFVPLSSPAENIMLDNEEEEEVQESWNHPWRVDEDVAWGIDDMLAKDTEKDDFVRNVVLEGHFFNMFRSSILGFFRRHPARLYELRSLVMETKYDYSRHLSVVGEYVKTTTGEYKVKPGIFRFVDFKKSALNLLWQFIQENGNWLDLLVVNDQILVPKHHLLNGNENQELYYYRIADDLIRNPRFQRLFFSDSNASRMLWRMQNNLVGPNEFIMTRSELDTRWKT